MWLTFLTLLTIFLMGAIFTKRYQRMQYQNMINQFVGGLPSFVLVHEAIKNFDVDESLYQKMQGMELENLQEYLIENQIIKQRQLESIMLLGYNQQFELIRKREL